MIEPNRPNPGIRSHNGTRHSAASAVQLKMPDPDTFLPPPLFRALCNALSIRLITVKMPEERGTVREGRW